MRLLCKLNFALVALLWFTPPVTQAQQPFATDDADVTAKGKLHFEFGNNFDLLQPPSFPTTKQNTASFELGYGLLENVEVSIEAPLVTLFNAGERGTQTTSGIGDTNLAVKYNFLKEREKSGRPALALSFNLELPTGDVDRGLGSGIADYSLNGILQKSVTPRTKLRANVGVIFSGNTVTGGIGIRARGLVFTGGTSVVREFTPKLFLGAEIAGVLSRNFDLSKGRLLFQVGGNYALRDNFTLDFAVASGRFAASPRLGAQLGFSIDF